jgi:hypothetical protein
MATLTDFLHNLAGKKSGGSAPNPGNKLAGVSLNPVKKITVPQSLPYVQDTYGGYPGADTNTGYDPSAYNSQVNSYNASYGYDPQAAADAQQKQSLIGDLQSKWSTLQNVFQGLFGKVDEYAKDATNRIQQGYDTQQNDLVGQYNKTQNQTASIYGARGIGDSSYLGDAQGPEQRSL